MEVNAAPQKLNNEKDDARTHSQQEQCKEQKQTTSLCYGSANDHLEQENRKLRKNDDIGRQKSHTDDQKSDINDHSVVERILDNDSSERKVCTYTYIHRTT